MLTFVYVATPLDSALLAAERTAWPEIEIDATAFDAFVAALDDDPTTLDLATLYLGFACIHGEPRAVAAFEHRYLALVPDYLARITTDPTLVDDVKQQLRIKLFVAPEPKIARYRRGSFGAWLRVVACRLAIDLLRERDQPLVPITDAALEARVSDPGLALVKQTYRDQVSSAFAAALSTLSATDRAMLRLCFLDDLGLEEIGRIYQLSKSAVSRRLSRCRAALLADAKRRLREQTDIAETELDSVMRLVTSQLHLSLPRLLAPET